MFNWPHCELTDYERKYVRLYKEGDYPGVLRRTYEIFMNTVADPLTPGLEDVKLKGTLQISRRSRVFGLGFAGRLGSWRLQIETASGEQMFPKSQQSDGYPVVSSLIAGSSWNALSALGDQPIIAGLETPATNLVSSFWGSETQGPMLIEPNWELAPNESLIFWGTPIDNEPTTEFPMTGTAQKLLAIAVHVWEFPGMDGKPNRGGISRDVGGK